MRAKHGTGRPVDAGAKKMMLPQSGQEEKPYTPLGKPLPYRYPEASAKTQPQSPETLARVSTPSKPQNHSPSRKQGRSTRTLPALHSLSVGAIHALNLADKTRLAHPVGAAIFSESAWGQIARQLDLSKRQLQLARSTFDDLTEFAIAVELGISPHTVHIHFNRLHQKLAVHTRVELVLRIIAEFLSPTFPQSAR